MIPLVLIAFIRMSLIHLAFPCFFFDGNTSQGFLHCTHCQKLRIAFTGELQQSDRFIARSQASVLPDGLLAVRV